MRGKAVRRIDYKKGKSIVRERTLIQLRDLRAKIMVDHPALIPAICQKIGGIAEDNAGSIAIDRQKNIKTVMEFLKMKDQSPAFRSKLNHLLSEYQR